MMKVSEQLKKIFVFVVLITVTAAADPSAEYLWPLPASKELTSNFCAYRAGHYHAGIDVRTFGKTGYNIVAVEDGYVWRVASNWWGYGRVIYLKLDDGNIAVYAHLSEFPRELEAYVRENQLKEGRYRVNLFPEKNQFRYNKGDYLGKTGQSGSGAPHLHFEIRTGENQPVHPLDFYPQLIDGYRPRFEEVTFRPLDYTGKVNGSSKPLTIDFNYSRENNNYYLNQVPIITGNVGLEVKVADRRNGTSRKYNVAGLKLHADDKLLYEIRYDTLSFDVWSTVEYDYNLYQRIINKSYYHNLYRYDGRQAAGHKYMSDLYSETMPAYNNLEYWLRDRGTSSATLSPLFTFDDGDHAVKILAYDRNNNIREAVFNIKIRTDRNRPAIYKSRADQMLESTLSRNYFSLDSSDAIIVSAFDRLKMAFIPIDTISEVKDFLATESQMAGIIHEMYLDDVDKDHYLYRFDIENRGETFLSFLAGIPTENINYFIDEGLAGEADFIEEIEFISSRPLVTIDASKLFRFLSSRDIRPFFMQAINSSAQIRFEPRPVIPPRESPYGQINTMFLEDLVKTRMLIDDYHIFDKLRPLKVNSNGYRISLEIDYPVGFFAKVSASTSGRGYQNDQIAIMPDDRMTPEGLNITLSLPQNCPDGKCAIYGISRDGDPSYSGNDTDSAGYLSATVYSLGTYRIMADTVGPEISRIYPGDGSTVKSAKPKIRFYMDDDLSGFASDTSLTVKIDGQYIVSEYDVDNKTVYSYPHFNLKPGAHELVIEVHDRMGNTTLKRSTFYYRPN